MRTTCSISAIALFLAGIFIGAAPVLAAGMNTSPAPNYAASTTNGKTTGTAEVQNIQQSLDSAEASMMTVQPTTNGTVSPNAAAQVQAPVESNPGTLAESAKSTALSTSTYQQ